LKAADFKLYEDRAEQPISSFDAVEEPLNVALIIDTSRSTQPVLEDIKSAAVKFLKELRPADRAMIPVLEGLLLASRIPGQFGRFPDGAAGAR
jgi:hypothetical protein